MPKSKYQQLQAQIAKLQQEAEAVRQTEIKGVVARIREAVEHYQLRPTDIFDKAAIRPNIRHAGKRKPQAKYRDKSGNTWGGMGPRPAWLRQALADGHSLDEYRV